MAPFCPTLHSPDVTYSRVGKSTVNINQEVKSVNLAVGMTEGTYKGGKLTFCVCTLYKNDHWEPDFILKMYFFRLMMYLLKKNICQTVQQDNYFHSDTNMFTLKLNYSLYTNDTQGFTDMLNVGYQVPRY